jgi:predicted metal-dependent enzyme (double-stranded beta helix superfamily)
MTANLAYATGNLRVDELADVVRWIAADETQWAHRVRAPGSDRWWTRLYADWALDVWLLTWLPGQFTDLHDHGDSAAAFAVARGELEEARLTFAGGRQISKCSGEPTLVDVGVVHDVRAIGDELAVSIHAYSPPLTRMTYYDADDGGLQVVRYVETNEPEQELSR